MNNRPRSVTVISWFFIAFGTIALLTSLLPKLPGTEQANTEFKSQHPILYAQMYFNVALAVICGVFMLRGCNWARWVLAVYFGNNVILSVIMSPSLKLLLSRLLFALLFGFAAYLLFRPQSTTFFRRQNAEPPQIPTPDQTTVA